MNKGVKINPARLAELQVEKGLDYVQLAKAAGVSRVTVHNVLNGKGCLLFTALSLAAALGVPLSELTEEAQP